LLDFYLLITRYPPIRSIIALNVDLNSKNYRNRQKNQKHEDSLVCIWIYFPGGFFHYGTPDENYALEGQ